MSVEEKLKRTRKQFQKLSRSTGAPTHELNRRMNICITQMQDLVSQIPNSSGNAIVYWYDELDTMTADVLSLRRRHASSANSSRNGQMRPPPSHPIPRTGRQSWDATPRLSRTEEFRRLQQGRCYRCNEHGHRWRNCPSRESVSRATDNGSNARNASDAGRGTGQGVDVPGTGTRGIEPPRGTGTREIEPSRGPRSFALDTLPSIEYELEYDQDW